MAQHNSLRVLIIGLGSIGQRHLRIARTLLPDADIRVLRHQAPEYVPQYANACMSSLEEALDFAPGVAVIASPSVFHMQTAIPLAQAGVDLLIEKPLAASLEYVDQLLRLCKVNGTVTMTAYNLRFLRSLRRFRDLLGEDAIGDVNSVRCEIGQYLPTWRSEIDYRKCVSANRALGGGALLELSHEIDYLRWIFGEVEWVQATLSRQSSLEINVEDTAHLILGFVPKGGRSLLGTLNMDFVRRDTTRTCLAIGERGSLCWNGISGTIEIFEAGTNTWREIFNYPPQRDESYLSEWTHFLTCVERREPPLVSVADGIRVLEIVEAAKKSSASRTAVEIRTVQL
jgi:predicted dehydrogenase